MNSRQEKILHCIVEGYIKTAQPVSSEQLVSQFDLDVSGATVRNDCRAMEELGFLTHPHTSAGRIPTEAGYRLFLEVRSDSKNFQDEQEKKKASIKDTKYLEDLRREIERLEFKSKIKKVAKALAELAEGAVIVGYGKSDSYYTGLSKLFSQPEFQDMNLVYNITEVVDHLDDAILQVYDDFPKEVTVRIGSKNPFGVDCSFVGIRTKDYLIGLLGPMRMDYLSNIERIGYINKLLGS